MKHVVIVNPQPRDAAPKDRDFELSLEYDDQVGMVEVVVTDSVGIRQGALVEAEVLDAAVNRLLQVVG